MQARNGHPGDVKGQWSVGSKEISQYGKMRTVKLPSNVRKIEVMSYNEAVTGSSGLNRAAAGAVIGFLVAGPAGTVLGAGAGAGGAKKGQNESYTATVSFWSGEFIIGDWSPVELEMVRAHLIDKAPEVYDPYKGLSSSDNYDIQFRIIPLIIAYLHDKESVMSGGKIDLQKSFSKLPARSIDGPVNDAKVKSSILELESLIKKKRKSEIRDKMLRALSLTTPEMVQREIKIYNLVSFANETSEFGELAEKVISFIVLSAIVLGIVLWLKS
jgi:hypothetical protein